MHPAYMGFRVVNNVPVRRETQRGLSLRYKMVVVEGVDPAHLKYRLPFPSPTVLPVIYRAMMKYSLVLLAAVHVALALPTPTLQGALVARSAAPETLVAKRGDGLVDRQVVGLSTDDTLTLEAGF